ncbi:hypothetical protein CRI94_11175 [Longibacter salinarum]|uniref:Uncharacterized protein n=1 Tax=Longibacter salinarum TaxID=1850348 RepID=A0A2A8CX22_9BACT|nr:hypothetical protein CRI94_11175 [Longibacter salinarum]
MADRDLRRLSDGIIARTDRQEVRPLAWPKAVRRTGSVWRMGYEKVRMNGPVSGADQGHRSAWMQ